MAANSLDHLFRSEEALQRLRLIKIKGGNLFGNPLLIYFTALIKYTSSLNGIETIEYLKLLDLKQQAKKVETLFQQSKLSHSKEISDYCSSIVIKQGQPRLSDKPMQRVGDFGIDDTQDFENMIGDLSCINDHMDCSQMSQVLSLKG